MKQGNGKSTVQNTLYYMFDDNEIDVVKTLLQLPVLIMESKFRNRYSMNWGTKRRRSALNLSPSPSPLLSMPPPPPPPITTTTTTTTPTPVNETCGGGDEILVRKPETPSPQTPSESEEKSKRYSRKISKRKRKREELLEMIAELTQRNKVLKGEVKTVILHYNKLKTSNLELKAKRKELSCGEKVGQCMEINESLNLRMEFGQPIVKSVMNIEDVEILENQHKPPCEEVQQHPCSSQLPPLWWSSSKNGDVGVVKVNNRDPHGIILNLNGSGMDSLQVHQQVNIRSTLMNTPDFNKAMAAEARKKRRQIYKLKNSIAANKPRHA